MKRVLKYLGIGLGVLALLVAVAVVLVAVFVDLDKVVNEQIAKAKPAIEEKLGRKVAVGTVATRIFPVLGGSVADIAIAQDPAHPEDDRPLLRIKSVGFDLALWEAIKSRGKSITVTDLYIDGLQVSLVRHKGGRLSYQDILDRQPKEDPAAPQAKEEPLSPEVLAYARAVSVDALRIVDAEIRLADHDTPTGKVAEDHVRRLNLKLNDLRLSDPIRIKLEAAVFAEKPNFELETTVGPLPQDLDFKALPHIAGVKVRISDVDLGKAAPYLGPAVPVKVASALLSTQWDVGEVSFEKPVTVAGSLAVRQLQLEGGKKFDLSLEAKAKADLKDLGTEIEKLILKVGTVELALSGALLDLAKVPRFKDFTVRSTTLDLAQLLAYYPAAAKALPPGSKLEGIATLDAKASSGDAGRQKVLANADLSALNVLIPGTFVKPKGTPLKLAVDGDFTTSNATLRKVGLVLDELDLGIKGTVKDFDKPVMDLTLAAKPFSFDRIVRLLPQAGQALTEQKAKASGDGSVSGHLKGTMTDLDAAFDLGLTGVKLDIPDTRLDGALTVSLAIVGNPKRDLKAAVVIDADRAVIKIKDTLDKTATTPLLVQLDADRRGDLLTVKRFSMLFAELKLDATGTFDLGKGTTALNVSMPRVDSERLSKTVTAIPADKAKKAFFDANVGVVGNPNKLETMAVELTSLDMKIGRSDLQGTVKIVNLVKPRAQIDVRSQLLDLDELQGAQAAKPAAPGTPSQPAPKTAPKDDPSLKDYRFTGKVDLKRVIVSQTELTDVKGDVELADGVLTLKQCNLRAFDGSINAAGTRAEIWKGRMPFTANLTIKGLDMNKVLVSKTRYGNSLHGRADLDLKASGEGFETAELEQKLLGSLRLGLNDGKLTKTSLTQSVLGGFTVLNKIPGVQTQNVAKAIVSDNAIRNLAAAIDIRDGKLNLSKPVTLNLDGNKLTLGGAIGIGGKLFLNGDYYVPAALVNQLTANKCKATSDLRVPVSIGGSITAPEFKPNAEPVLAGLLQACLQGEAAKKVEDVAKKEGEKLLKGLFK